jgi:ribosomal protein S18 acetylase RimI-like enzyme
MLYVDALATEPAHRRRGVAGALLEEADRLAAAAGLDGVALDTGIENRAARALYERSGFTPSSLRPAPDERTARALGGSGFVGYVKPRARG